MLIAYLMENMRKNFEILNSFIADFSNFCDFFTYIKVYVEAKEKGEDLTEIKRKYKRVYLKV